MTPSLPYVNSIPHLGNAVCVVSADVFNRFLKKEGCESRFICGTDEHGTRTEIEAKKRKMDPDKYCEQMNQKFKDVFDFIGVEFDHFGRTNNPVNHEITQSIFKDLYDKGYIFDKELTLLYCEKCKMYLADSYVEGTCPHCGAEDAKGDQCDNCSKFLEPVELIHPKCKICGSVPVVKRDMHIFLDLKKLQPKVKKWLLSNKNLKDDVKNFSLGWIKEGLHPRCISRNLKYGVKVPLKGFEDKVFYVWFDAPIGYFGATAEKYKDWKSWWQSAQHYEFMGKDNVPFHTIFFPAMLLGSNENDNKWVLPTNIGVNQNLNYEGKKFSKSHKRGIFLDDFMKLDIKADVLRYYIISVRSLHKDTEFSWDAFLGKNNNELVANYGNLVYRTLVFMSKNFGCVPDVAVDKSVVDEVSEKLSAADKFYWDLDFKEALKLIMEASSIANQYFQHSAPWDLVKTDKDKCSVVLRTCSEVILMLSKALWPIIPSASESVFKQLGFDKFDFSAKIKGGQKLGKVKVLFKKFDESMIDKYRDKFSGDLSEEDIFNLMDLRVAKIVDVKVHPDAKKLFIVDLDVGAYKRTIVSGLREHFSVDDLLGKKIILFSNLEPAKIRGVKSEGMLLAACGSGKLGLLGSDDKIGERVYAKSCSTPAKSVSYDNFSKLEILVDKDGNVVFCSHILKTSRGKIKVSGVGKGAKVC
ncbi:MAG: methionine--tRNA ligase [Candidatus Aenigmarchaeota archaeon]|nr:methionine--tRNA ligase [Candidatus Aenigmarchaeota archaeon]